MYFQTCPLSMWNTGGMTMDLGWQMPNTLYLLWESDSSLDLLWKSSLISQSLSPKMLLGQVGRSQIRGAHHLYSIPRENNTSQKHKLLLSKFSVIKNGQSRQQWNLLSLSLTPKLNLVKVSLHYWSIGLMSWAQTMGIGSSAVVISVLSDVRPEVSSWRMLSNCGTGMERVVTWSICEGIILLLAFKKTSRDGFSFSFGTGGLPR